MKYKQITILTIFLMFVFICSLSTISAADQTINNSTGISTGINGTGDGNTLTLQEGIYDKNTDYGITINKSITIKGDTSTNNVIIDAKGQDRIFIINANIHVTFINIKFINGNTTGNGGAISSGTGATVTIRNCTFINNIAGDYGGAIYNNNSANIAVIDSKFTDNYLSKNNGYGGAIYNNASADFTVINSTFNGNNATYGAAIYNNNGANFAVIDSNFTNNKASRAGGIYNDNGADFTVTNSTFDGNNVSTYGAAIYNNGGANFTVIDSNFTDNNATRGGAIYNTGTGAYNFTVLNSTFTINNANLGGAIYNNNGDTSTVVNSTFINNKATASNGGAIYNGGAYFTVDNSTFKSNKANNGGAIYNTAFDFTVNNSNFTGNEATVNGGAIYNSATANIRAYDNNMVDNVAGDSGNDIYDLGTISIGNSIINVPDELIVGKKVTITGVLIDWKGNPVDGAELNVIIDDVSYKVITNPDGTWALTYPLDTGGNFTIAVILTNNNSNNNNLYANFRNSTELFVSKISTNSTINAPNTKAKQNTTIVGVVTDGSGNFLANLKITLNINGVNYIVTTNSNGVWSSPQALNVSGNFSVVVTWEGNTTYDGFVNSTYWAVNKLNADSTIVVTNATVGKSTNINGVAKDENGAVLTGITLTVTIAGENRTVITNSNGSWNLSYTPTTEGNFNVVVTWAGNIINNGFNVSNMIKVAKANVSMTPTPTPTNIKISAQSTKKIKTNVYSKSISFKNYGQKTGSKKFTISINKKYKITRVVKSKNISYNYNKKTNKLTVNVKNLAHSKVSKIQYKIAKK